MKKFSFRLKRVLDIRHAQQEQKLAEFGSETHKLKVEEEKLELFQNEADSQSDQIRKEQQESFNIWMKNENTRYLKRIAHVVEYQSQNVTNQATAVESARLEFLDARRNTLSLEKLLDKQKEAWNKEMQSYEANDLDDFKVRSEGVEA